jgi:hypothetical protein
MPVYIERPSAPPTFDAKRSPIIQTLLLGIGIAYINVAIFILIFSEPPTFQHFLWAAGLGIGCGLLTFQRRSQPAKPAETAQSETVLQS